MSTEYRRGIPSTAHVEAATRLGLLWEDDDVGLMKARWRLVIHEDASICCDYATSDTNYSNWDTSPIIRAPDTGLAYRPIHPDGTPVDWEVLDQEVARVGRQGQPSAQPQGFRADLWRRIGEWVDAVWLNNLNDIVAIDYVGLRGHREQRTWHYMGFDPAVLAMVNDRQALIACWTVYQELKPLYDLVDGAQGEAAMPRDVEVEWATISTGADGNLRRRDLNVRIGRDAESLYVRSSLVWRPNTEGSYSAPLRNFAAILDAVAERRVAERMRGQTQAPTVTSVQPEPRRFADARPDRHGWRWWRMWGSGCIPTGSSIECQPDLGWRIKSNGMYTFDWNVPNSSDADRPVIPTDEQGNPVSWESIEQAQAQVDLGQPITQLESAPAPAFSVLRSRHVARLPTQASVAADVGESARQVVESQGWQVSEFPGDSSGERVTFTMPLPTTTGTYRAEVAAQIQPGQVITGPAGIEQVSPTPSRFALIEIDDADPTAERIRQEQEAERQRLAELRQRLAAERAALPQEKVKESEASRFDLIEPDPQADPTASIRAWEARQAAAKVRPIAVPPRIAKPAVAPRRPAIEVVDAEVDGLSWVEVVTALVGRAFNGGC